MERVKTLTDKLQEQLAQNAGIDQLLTTVEMLRSELEHLKLIQPPHTGAAPAVAIAIAPVVVEKAAAGSPPADMPEEKIVEVLQVDESALEAELEEIKRIAKEKSSIGAQNKPTVVFDPIEDIPTLAHQQSPAPEPHKEVHEKITNSSANSLNDKLKEHKNELFDALADAPIRDLKKAIGINDKFLFINDLFRGDET